MSTTSPAPQTPQTEAQLQSQSQNMQRYFARIVRALIVTTLGVGGGVALCVFIFCVVTGHQTDAWRHSLYAGFVIGLCVAVLFVCVLLPRDLITKMFLAKGQYREIWELEQTLDMEVEGTLKEVFAACRQALLSVPYVRAVSDDFENLVATANTGPSWRSSGEEIQVEINPLSENRWHLKCSSHSHTRDIVFDYGKNFENVDVWATQMRNAVKVIEKTV